MPETCPLIVSRNSNNLWEMNLDDKMFQRKSWFLWCKSVYSITMQQRDALWVWFFLKAFYFLQIENCEEWISVFNQINFLKWKKIGELWIRNEPVEWHCSFFQIKKILVKTFFLNLLWVKPCFVKRDTRKPSRKSLNPFKVCCCWVLYNDKNTYILGIRKTKYTKRELLK